MSEHYYKKNRPSQRQLQIGSLIHKVVVKAIIIDEVLYSKFSSVSVIGVRMIGGLKQATIMFITTDDDIAKIKIALKKSSDYFRKIIASELNIRFTPEIDFQYDKATAQFDLLQQNLEKIRL
jgi:ribosome-binding factor A